MERQYKSNTAPSAVNWIRASLAKVFIVSQIHCKYIKNMLQIHYNANTLQIQFNLNFTLAVEWSTAVLPVYIDQIMSKYSLCYKYIVW